MAESKLLQPQAYSEPVARVRKVFVRDLEVLAYVGIYEIEKVRQQRLVISVELDVLEDEFPHDDQLDNVVCYETVVKQIKEICYREHVNLIETVAERIAEQCLLDNRVAAVRVRIEKPDVIDDCRTVGIEIERQKNLD
ncbi:MAG: dihydroneopterin aldolase [Methyloligellaceae bacterium]